MTDLSDGPIAQNFEQSIILTFPGQALSHGVAGSTLSWVPQCDSNSARLSGEKRIKALPIVVGFLWVLRFPDSY